MVQLSPYLLAAGIGWMMSQGLKYLIMSAESRKLLGLRQLYISGNMPSAHSATVVACATVIGLRDGIDSAIFALACLIASVVMYDAMMVRRSSGEQGIALRKLLAEQKSNIHLPRAAQGHTPLEVAVGGLLGWSVGIVVFFAT